MVHCDNFSHACTHAGNNCYLKNRTWYFFGQNRKHVRNVSIPFVAAAFLRLRSATIFKAFRRAINTTHCKVICRRRLVCIASWWVWLLLSASHVYLYTLIERRGAVTGWAHCAVEKEIFAERRGCIQEFVFLEEVGQTNVITCTKHLFHSNLKLFRWMLIPFPHTPP